MTQSRPLNLSSGRSEAVDIRIRGAFQNNLKHIDLDIAPGTFTVITGPSGSGKSSLAFDTLYAEGQRRYVETFSAYARQFLDRCDRPKVESIDGVPPAIAIEQKNSVRTSRSTVGTMTEINDHIKLLFARQADLYCPGCGAPVRSMSVERMVDDLLVWAARWGNPRIHIAFETRLGPGLDVGIAISGLSAQGYTHILDQRVEDGRTILTVAADRMRLEKARQVRPRLIEAFEKAGERDFNQQVLAIAADDDGVLHRRRYRPGLACPDCELTFRDPTPAMFSFNSAVGACSRCRGFGKTLGVDMGLVIPDENLSLEGGAVSAWKRTGKNRECLNHMLKCAKRDGIPTDVPFRLLSEKEKNWVIEGEPGWCGRWETQWWGIRNWFAWVESQAGYKVGMRMILSRYRSETVCTACNGGRLDTASLWWRVGSLQAARAALGEPQDDSAGPRPSDDGRGAYRRFRPAGFKVPALERLDRTPGLTVHDLMCLPVVRLQKFFARLAREAKDEACSLVIDEIVTRLNYLCDVGLGYLTLGRQSKTLSGGEVQRVNLTTALGTNLVDSLFVLDEPSVGLHPRDMDRVNAIIARLKNVGNTLVVVEHDPQVMLAADRIVDMGPGAGQNGGSIVFDGTPAALRRAGCLTGLYLRGQLNVDKYPHVPEDRMRDWAGVRGVREHNLKNIDFSFPLRALTTVTGVSGSGKSTLVADVLVPAFGRRLGRKTVAGAHTSVFGSELFDDVVFVDQTAIGANARSNPALYIGAFDSIRILFAQSRKSIERNYTASTFSFNTGDGRCPECQGSGFETVEMLFLSDIHIVCQECQGRRYRPETLEVKINVSGRGEKSVADVLEMTVDEAVAYFAGLRDIARPLQCLADVGLGYIRLGQPMSTLSGGEAQRLKLAEIFARGQAAGKRSTLYVFDEPTTGLHFDDIDKLLQALRRLVAAGHTVLAVEHNLDMIRSSDWIVDLGPEGGDDGGRIVCTGTPAKVAADPASHTGAALKAYAQIVGPAARDVPVALSRPLTPAAPVAGAHGKSLQSVWRRARAGDMGIFGAREHNLKNIDVVIPKKELTVVSGVSGSGKSTLAFGIVFSEGQRRYLDSLNAYARSIIQPPARPDVEQVVGIAPTVAIEQRTTRGNNKSTVATQTEILHFLRLLFVKLGVQHCPKCGIAVTSQSQSTIYDDIMRRWRGKTVTLTAPIVVNRTGDYAKLAEDHSKKGVPILRIDGRWKATSPFRKLTRYRTHTIELPCGTIEVGPENRHELELAIDKALGNGNGFMNVVKEAPDANRRNGTTTLGSYSNKRACPQCGASFAEADPRLFSYNSRIGWCPYCQGVGKKPFRAPWLIADSLEEVDYSEELCPVCDGARLNPTALAVRFEGHGIAEFTRSPVDACLELVRSIHLAGRSKTVGEDALKEISSRLEFLQKVGLGYISLDRDAPSLSGGEAQRIRIAAQLGSNLQGVCYVLDEPTIGLHARDNALLIDTLTALKNKGNTVIVVEHDEEMIRRADNIIDIGPGAGSRGGEVLAAGTLDELARSADSVTARMLAHPAAHDGKARRPAKGAEMLKISGIRCRNIDGMDLALPLGRLVVLTGVSGSGKSTLARKVLVPNVSGLLSQQDGGPQWCQSVEGYGNLDRVLEVDQSPIGKTPRSCPATYVGVFDHIRQLFAQTDEAQARGYTVGRFSFNKEEGRCPECEGYGEVLVAMSFLPDVKVRCQVCGGARFNPETLAVKWQGMSIGRILDLSVDEAHEVFSAQARIARPLELMQDVGLGYLRLGQPSTTLSGGEMQRIKLVTELAKTYSASGRPVRRPIRTLYVLDEPTVGLHMADVEKLLGVIHRLVDAGHSVLIIEHNLDVIAQADHVIDLGPDGGPGGGRIVGEGAPAAIARLDTPTGRALKAYLDGHKPARRPRAAKTAPNAAGTEQAP